ncbi:MAG: hypothetical protein BMS9Abin10_0328 [Gammaproteobacteria bacterium]|nr:MAG: hypothetical protein BMS9Abin10_0328 [Gammaproteobacteria bacterium]
MREPKTLQEYIDLVDQAVFEVGDLLACADDEGDGDYQLSQLRPIYEQLETELKKLQADIASGQHSGLGAGSDLLFMPLATRSKRAIPFYDLLETLNNVHRSGFVDVE